MELSKNTWIAHAAENPARKKDVLAALRLDGDLMQLINREGELAKSEEDEEEETYRSYCMEAVQASGMALRFCSHKMRDDESKHTSNLPLLAIYGSSPRYSLTACLCSQMWWWRRWSRTPERAPSPHRRCAP